MAEFPTLHLTERLHTGHIWDATQELLHYDLKVAGEIRKRLEDIRPASHPLPSPILVGLAFNPEALSEAMRKHWKEAEAKTGRVMASAKILKDPVIVWSNLFKKLPYTQELPSIQEGIGYVELLSKRLEHLKQPSTRQKMGSLTWGTYIYTENLILRAAVHSRVFFVPAQPGNFSKN